MAGGAAARAEGSAWPSRYWMERSWKQGSASSTAVARSVLPRDTPQTTDSPPCAPTPACPASAPPLQGNILKCSQRAAVILLLLLCHPDSQALGIDAAIQHLLRLQPLGQCLSLGCCRAAEASRAAPGHSTSREMLCRASCQGLGPSCTNRTAQGALRVSRSPKRQEGEVVALAGFTGHRQDG